MDRIDAVVIGAGVVGLAIARELAARGHETLILEAAAGIGEGASSRNSEVIHGGLYYPPGSLRARLCVAGRERLYEFCRERGIAHRRCGKLVVGDETQLPALKRLAANARTNGVETEWLEVAQVQALEPGLRCAAALHSPESGIVDTHGLMLALLADAESRGATLSCRSAVTRMVLEDDAVLIGVNGAPPALRAHIMVNSAGVQAPAVAHLIEGFPAQHIPRAYFAKGSYFSLRGRAPFQVARASARTFNGSMPASSTWMRHAAARSMRRSAATGPRSGTAPSIRLTRVCGRGSTGRDRLRRTSASMTLRGTGSARC